MLQKGAERHLLDSLAEESASWPIVLSRWCTLPGDYPRYEKLVNKVDNSWINNRGKILTRIPLDKR